VSDKIVETEEAPSRLDDGLAEDSMMLPGTEHQEHDPGIDRHADAQKGETTDRRRRQNRDSQRAFRKRQQDKTRLLREEVLLLRYQKEQLL
jgi:hypothetical protein